MKTFLSKPPVSGQPRPLQLLSVEQTAACLSYTGLAQEIARLLQDASVRVPARLVQALPGGASLFVMPAGDDRFSITKLITFTPANAGTSRPAIQGCVVVFDTATGEPKLILDGPTVTARRTAAVSLLAAQCLAHTPRGPLLVVGAGVQGKAHLEAFAEGLGVRHVLVHSRNPASAARLVAHAQALGLKAEVAADADTALAACPLVVTCTPAQAVVLSSLPRPDAFVAAVGAFTPQMVELEADLCRHFAERGCIVVDTADASHEAGDLLQAGIDVPSLHTLQDVLRSPFQKPAGPVLFKSCGWAGWDLAAARLACAQFG